MKSKLRNIFSISGIIIGWFIPILGIFLGIIALTEKENKFLAWFSIIEGIILLTIIGIIILIFLILL